MRPQMLLKLSHSVQCRIIARANRFVVEVEVSGVARGAHTNNTGRLEQFLTAGRQAFCLWRDTPGKTDLRLFAVKDMDAAAIIDTRLQMQAFEAAVRHGLISWLDGCSIVKRNARLGSSLIDYLLDCRGVPAYLEVKSAVLREDNYAMYPDCPTARGRRHITELTDHVRSGGLALIVFIAALPGVTAFKPYRQGDPDLFECLRKAKKAGVQLKAIQMVHEPGSQAIVLVNGDVRVEV
jgi:sugar fermentation stimulation protein A